MEIIFYIIMFVMGSYFGSFFTLAVYRIPKNENILYKHSYCPNCNHKLRTLDLIPILSYIFLRAKCRYCKQKIIPRYFLLEIFTGTVFLTYSVSLDLYNLILTKNNILFPIIGILYISGLFIIAGIDKEKKDVNKFVLIYQTSIVLFYLFFSFTSNIIRIEAFIIQILILTILYLIKTNKTKYTKSTYGIDSIILFYLMYIYCNFKIIGLTLILFIILLGINYIIKKAKHKEIKPIPIAFYLIVSNIISIIMFNLLIK